MINLPKKIYFLGIGGIGLSAIARLALHQGSTVYGCDLANSKIIENLKKRGATITTNKEKIDILDKNIDLLIYTNAVREDHPKLLQAQKKNIKILSYPQVLGEISKSHFTIAISGMHGKTTTTAIVGLMLESAYRDPLVIVGTKVGAWNGNIRIPKTQKFDNYFVVEADEYKSAMCNLEPNIIVLTRVEEDHLDYYKNLDHIKQEFIRYFGKLKKNGVIIANSQDQNISEITQSLNCSIIQYNTEEDVKIKEKIKKIFKIPGKHNLENALAAYKVGERLNLNERQILKGLSHFTGTWRRLETVGNLSKAKLKAKLSLKKLSFKFSSIPVISDYAHHPTEIVATLQALKEKYPDDRLILAYQPHQHNRTKKLFKNFVTAFAGADIVIINEIFDVAGREETQDQNISSRDIVKEIIKQKLRDPSTIQYTKTLFDTKEAICKIAQKNDIIVIMGAGNIDQIARELVR